MRLSSHPKMNNPRRLHLCIAAPIALLSIVCLLASPVSANSLTFELPYGQRKCFSEDLPPDTRTLGTVHVSSGHGDMTLDLFVADPRGKVYFHRANVDTVKFSFVTGQGPQHSRENYRFCVVNQVAANAARPAHDVVRRVTLEVDTLRPSSETPAKRIAKQEHVEKVFASFVNVQSDIDDLIEKMDELRAREQMLTDANTQTTTVIFRISLLACVLTIVTGLLNFISLKSFFKRKKLA